MSQAALPLPNIKEISPAEMQMIYEELDQLIEAEDYENIASLAESYPLSAEGLDDLKKNYGMDFLLRNKCNLINAVKKYGEKWLES